MYLCGKIGHLISSYTAKTSALWQNRAYICRKVISALPRAKTVPLGFWQTAQICEQRIVTCVHSATL